PSPSPSPSPAATPTSGLPGPRAGATLVYDPENKGVILFGGVYTVPRSDGTNEGVSTGDTWLWAGKSWQRLEVSGPPARSVPMAAYDSARHVVVLFGSGGPSGAPPAQLLNDTLTWDGVSWTEMHPAHVPAGGARFELHDICPCRQADRRLRLLRPRQPRSGRLHHHLGRIAVDRSDQREPTKPACRRRHRLRPGHPSGGRLRWDVRPTATVCGDMGLGRLDVVLVESRGGRIVFRRERTQERQAFPGTA